MPDRSNPFRETEILPWAGRRRHSNGGWGSRATLLGLGLGLGLGQRVSLLVTATGFASSELSQRGINVPPSQSLLSYLLLGVLYGSISIHRRKPLQMKWYYYLILGLVDVEANYLGFTNTHP